MPTAGKTTPAPPRLKRHCGRTTHNTPKNAPVLQYGTYKNIGFFNCHIVYENAAKYHAFNSGSISRFFGAMIPKLPYPRNLYNANQRLLRQQGCYTAGKTPYASNRQENPVIGDTNGPFAPGEELAPACMEYAAEMVHRGLPGLPEIVRQMTRAQIQKLITCAQVNVYDRKASLAFHQDDEQQFDAIIGFSFLENEKGGERSLAISEDKRGTRVLCTLRTRHCDVIAMCGSNFQTKLWHAVLSERVRSTRRLSITVRFNFTPAE